MPIDVEQINDDQKELVAHIDEGHYSDVKSINIRPARLTEAIAAFANADGGELYIGIDEIGSAKDTPMERFRRHRSSKCSHPSLRATFPA